MAHIINRPTEIEHRKLRFMIMDAPSDENLSAYLKEMKAFGVTDLVRTCEPTYDASKLADEGITVHEISFPDGEPPSSEVIKRWMEIVSSVAKKSAAVHHGGGTAAGAEKRQGAIAVHCVAGLGRAPVLVAVAMIEKGMDALDAIMFIRERRRGAINAKQLRFLESYKPQYSGNRCCSIM